MAAVSFVIESPSFASSAARCGSSTPSFAKTYFTMPLQSRPLAGLSPAHLYFTPSRLRVCSMIESRCSGREPGERPGRVRLALRHRLRRHP